METSKKTVVIKITQLVLFLVVIQALRIVLIKACSLAIQPTIFTRNCMSAIVVTVIGVILLLIAKKKNQILSFFPSLQSAKSKIIYSVISLPVFFIIVSSPAFGEGYTPSILVPLVYSVIITPLFEELIFRGFLWNTLKPYFKNEMLVYIITALLFAVWHLGYFDTILFAMGQNGLHDNIVIVMVLKMLTGLIFGIITGFVRLKCKNCYASFLVHSVLNVFGR